jgi:NADH-quinone oxidoreductase subunit I
MYCGICIEACPFDALFWSPEFEYAELDIRDLTHGKERLGEWMATVPPPPAHDVLGVRPKELDTAAAAVAKAAPGASSDRAPRHRSEGAAAAGSAAAESADAGTVPVETAEPAAAGPAVEELAVEESAAEPEGAGPEGGQAGRRPLGGVVWAPEEDER